MKVMEPGRIEALNRRACEIANISHEEIDDTKFRFVLYDAFARVISEEDLAFVRHAGGDPDMAGTTAGPQCEVYRDPRTGALVNLWIDGDALGFDDQVEED